MKATSSFRPYFTANLAFAKSYINSCIGFALLFEKEGKFFAAYSAKEARLMREGGFKATSILG